MGNLFSKPDPPGALLVLPTPLVVGAASTSSASSDNSGIVDSTSSPAAGAEGVSSNPNNATGMTDSSSSNPTTSGSTATDSATEAGGIITSTIKESGYDLKRKFDLIFQAQKKIRLQPEREGWEYGSVCSKPDPPGALATRGSTGVTPRVANTTAATTVATAGAGDVSSSTSSNESNNKKIDLQPPKLKGLEYWSYLIEHVRQVTQQFNQAQEQSLEGQFEDKDLEKLKLDELELVKIADKLQKICSKWELQNRNAKILEQARDEIQLQTRTDEHHDHYYGLKLLEQGAQLLEDKQAQLDNADADTAYDDDDDDDDEYEKFVFNELQKIYCHGSLGASKSDQAELKKKKKEEEPQFLQREEIWVGKILPFVGPGQFLYVSLVSLKFKDYYEKYFSTLDKKKLPMVNFTAGRYTSTIYSQKAMATNTYYSAAFSSSIACAKIWEEDTRGETRRLVHTWNRGITKTVANYGNLSVLKWTHRLQGFELNEWTTCAAAEFGHAKILRYLHKIGCPWNVWTSRAAAGYGCLDTVKFIHENGCPWDSYTCSTAAANGHLEILQYLHQNGCPWDEETCREAAENDHFDCLLYARESSPQCPWDETQMCAAAAVGGSLEMLIWLRGQDPPCTWNEYTASVAAEHGHLDILKYAHENGCDLDKSEALEKAIDNGHFDCVVYAHKNGCEWDSYYACPMAASGGHVRILQYLHEQGCPWDEDVIWLAAESGHLQVLKWARGLDKPCPWDYWIIWQAVGGGHLEVLEWADKNGCPWDADAKYCSRAAGQGYVEVLKWLVEKGCPLDERSTRSSAMNGHLNCLRFAHENGCPWDKDTCLLALEKDNLRCLRYAIRNGCPCPDDVLEKAKAKGMDI